MIRLRNYLVILIIVAFFAGSMAGSWYVWTTFTSVQTNLPVSALKWHRNLSSLIQTLSNLTENLGRVNADPSMANLDELTISLDRAFTAERALDIKGMEKENVIVQDINDEIQWLMDSIEMLVDEAPPLNRLRAELLHTRLKYAVAQLENGYLAINQESVRALSEQSLVLGHLRNNTLLLLSIIGVANLLVLFLLMWFYKTNLSLSVARKNLADSEQLFRDFTDTASDWVWEAGPDLRITHISKQFLDISHYRLDDVLGKTCWQVTGSEAMSFAPKAWQSHQDDMENHQPFHDFEYLLKIENGKPIHINMNGKPVFDSAGNFLGYRGTGTDISKRKEMEAALIQLKNEAERANLAKSEFLSNMSHELRTPMNAILGFAQILELDKESLTPGQVSSVEEIKNGGEHLLTLINEMLDLAKIEAGKLTVSIDCIPLQTTFDECHTLTSALAEKNGIQFDVTNAEAYLVHADPLRLKQVLLNYLSNAVKYNRPNGHVQLYCEPVDDKRLRISVTDSGYGLNEDQLTHLFQPFERVAAQSSEIEGTGIGLVISKKLVELMGGTVGVSSEEGKGSTFWLELSYQQKITSPEAIQTTEKNIPIETKQDTARTAASILYIEDNPANLRLLEQFIKTQTNYTLLTAVEPHAGLVLAASHSPDLILLDINLPGMDGFEVLKQLRTNPALQDIPVFAISANAMPDDIEKGMAAGFDDYIPKPIDFDKLLKSVEQACRQNG